MPWTAMVGNLQESCGNLGGKTGDDRRGNRAGKLWADRTPFFIISYRSKTTSCRPASFPIFPRKLSQHFSRRFSLPSLPSFSPQVLPLPSKTWVARRRLDLKNTHASRRLSVFHPRPQSPSAPSLLPQTQTIHMAAISNPKRPQLPARDQTPTHTH